jgi:hypothetical protein
LYREGDWDVVLQELMYTSVQVMCLVEHALTMDARVSDVEHSEGVRRQDRRMTNDVEQSWADRFEDLSLEGLLLESRGRFDDALALYSRLEKESERAIEGGQRDRGEYGIACGDKSADADGHEVKWRAECEYLETVLEAYRSADGVLK